MGYENMNQAQAGHTGIETFHYIGIFFIICVIVVVFLRNFLKH